MNAELNKGDINEVKAIANDVKQNLEKINHHGKQADAIVKGMLQAQPGRQRQKSQPISMLYVMSISGWPTMACGHGTKHSMRNLKPRLMKRSGK